VKAISLALISNAQSSGLVWLALGGNGITDKGAEHLAFALKIQHAPTGLTSRMVEEQGRPGGKHARLIINAEEKHPRREGAR
jgi:hypothetical protein